MFAEDVFSSTHDFRHDTSDSRCFFFYDYPFFYLKKKNPRFWKYSLIICLNVTFLILCYDCCVVSGDEARSSLELEGVRVSDSCEFTHVGCNISVAERQRSRVYTEVLRSYEDFHSRINSLEEAKNKILRYNFFDNWELW